MESLKNKFLLLDTNVLIFALRSRDVSADFFKKLEILKVVPVVDQTICFEFLRGAYNKESRKDFEEFIKGLTQTDVRDALPIKKETLDTAALIANIYNRHKKNGVETGDCLIAAQLEKYSRSNIGHTYLATINPIDFPTILFDIVDICPAFSKENLGCSIYILQFNQVKFASEKDKFN